VAEDAGFHVGYQRLHEELRAVQLYTFYNSFVHGLRYTCGVGGKKPCKPYIRVFNARIPGCAAQK
jgi:hypothetical protein